ncbi:F-actin-capping protein-like protein subunit alpha-1 [Tothia fuscella]|uniref:F-actin-capping protein subunit alpha n=1 Tax=Tothia fuscella TaxID=1048955 RepID=A0A9P4U2W4_9PEZI|nr:F-actin-capping protein-like protein subunit alpha-1 [Tothia fuscella]
MVSVFKREALSSFIQSAPPGELSNVTTAIKTLTGDKTITTSLEPALRKYNEEQFTTVKLPGGSQPVLMSEYNRLEDGRYYDIESQSSWAFDHESQKASAVQSYVPESKHNDLITSLYKSLSTHASEHYPSNTIGIYPTSDDSTLAILTVSNKYSPSNFWNGRWRSSYTFSPSSSTLTGRISVDVHYYEDGNVRLLTSKALDLKISSGADAGHVVKAIAVAEKKYQQELNRGFAGLSEGAFKGLRRQLPVTRQKMEWEKVGGYRVGQDIGGGRFKS